MMMIGCHQDNGCNYSVFHIEMGHLSDIVEVQHLLDVYIEQYHLRL